MTEPAGPLRIALVSEGTYPFAMGGVSTWCDQLIRGMPDCQWQMVALTVDGSERPRWSPPANLEDVRSIPVWGACPSPQHHRGRRGARVRRSERAFLSSYRELLRAMLETHDWRSEAAAVARSRFLLALRGIYEYASTGGDLCAPMLGNDGLALLVEAWREVHQSDLSLAHAVEAADLMAHMLRPFAAPPVHCDVVHAAMNGLSMLVAMAAKWRSGTPIVLSEHGVYLRERYLDYLDAATVPRPVKVLVLSFHRSLAAASYLIADAAAPHSSYNSRWQLRNGADPERVWTMYNGVSLDEFPFAQDEPDRPTIVFMGRISPIKDLHTLITAFPSVLAEVPDALLRIYGTAAPTEVEYERSCQRLIDELGLGGAVVMEGAVDSPVTAYHAGTIVALTSISEGFPVVILEAMACGRPIVCTNVGGVNEAVAEAGIVVPPRDPRAVARACVTLLVDHEKRARMREAARARVLRLFTLEESIDAYRRVYDNLTGAAAQLPAVGAPIVDAGVGPAPRTVRPRTATPARAMTPAGGRVSVHSLGAPRARGRVPAPVGGAL